MDGEHGLAKIDDGVPPGGSHVYIWNITDNFSPTEEDDNCVPWAYHSHVDSMRDIETGLVGVLLTCKPGMSSLILSIVIGGNVGICRQHRSQVRLHSALLFRIF